MPLVTIIKENKYYLATFTAWIILGGYLLTSYSQEQLFYYFNKGFISQQADYFFYVFSGFGRGDMITVVMLLLLAFKRYRNLQYFVIGIAFAIIAPITGFLLKNYFDCPRPPLLLGPENVHVPDLVPVLYEHSFPSGHTLGAFAFCTLLALFIPKKHKAWALLLIIPAILAGIARIYLGAHFFKDVYAGSIIGFAISFIIFVVVNRFIPTNEK